MLPRFHTRPINVVVYDGSIGRTSFEHAGVLWVYDNNWGTTPIGKVGNRNEYQLRITKHVEAKYNVIIINNLLLDDEERSQNYFNDKL